MRPWFCLLLSLLLLGCAGRNPPTRYYLLQPSAVPQAIGNGQTLGVGPVVLQRYLNRNEIVTDAGGGELQLAEFEHWAEPLQDNVAQVLAENLARLTGARQALIYPWPHDRPVDVQIEVDVGQFHAEADGAVVLRAQWSGYRNGTLWRTGRSDIRLPGGPSDYRAIAARHGEALTALSRDIAAAITPLD